VRGGRTGPSLSGEQNASGVSGPVLFARYAYPPNALGYCGPADPAALLAAGADGRDVDTLSHLAARFEGAWPYLQLIASSNRIADPLDRRVVEAYWVGNPLVTRVPRAALATSLDDRFERRIRRHFGDLMAAVETGGIPQHSFHVFAAYPWLGLLRAGHDSAAPLEVLDRCRIRWGRVVSIDGVDLVTVSSRPLGFEGSRLVLCSPQLEVVRCSVDGEGFVSGLVPGDVVSLHWDWVCDRLTVSELAWLQASTRRNLDAVNVLPRPGPAAVCDA
jgi:Family of unknown function (DUF6390)